MVVGSCASRVSRSGWGMQFTGSEMPVPRRSTPMSEKVDSTSSGRVSARRTAYRVPGSPPTSLTTTRGMRPVPTFVSPIRVRPSPGRPGASSESVIRAQDTGSESATSRPSSRSGSQSSHAREEFLGSARSGSGTLGESSVSEAGAGAFSPSSTAGRDDGPAVQLAAHSPTRTAVTSWRRARPRRGTEPVLTSCG